MFNIKSPQLGAFIRYGLSKFSRKLATQYAATDININPKVMKNGNSVTSVVSTDGTARKKATVEEQRTINIHDIPRKYKNAILYLMATRSAENFNSILPSVIIPNRSALPVMRNTTLKQSVSINQIMTMPNSKLFL
jgi:hypothetical protein